METEDGRVFIKNLAYYIRTHEKALANALQLQRPQPTRGDSSTVAGRRPATASSISSLASQRGISQPSTTFASALSLSSFGFGSQTPKPAKLYLTPNQLYYLLARFEELGVTVGPLNVRLESIHADSTSMNYVSFLTQTQRPKGRSSDQDSLHSVSSVRSVMSSMSSMLTSFSLSSNSEAKKEKRKAAELEDIRYLYSAFTKIPCLKLVLDHRIKRISGYEEFPFDTAVPIYVFKNLTVLEIVDQDFRCFFGWDRLAEQLRSLTIKRGEVDDPVDLLTNIVLDDMDKRRRRSTKNQTSPTMAFSAPSPSMKHAELNTRSAIADSPPVATPPIHGEGPFVSDRFPQPSDSGGRVQSVSPPRPPNPRTGSSNLLTKRPRRPSSSSTSSNPSHTPRTSSSNLLSSMGGMPANKWRFLRHLSLADNGLTSISGQSLLPLVGTLQSLDLSSNLFSEIPDSLASLISLRALNLSNCMIESLHTLTRSPLPAITVFNLRGNRLESLAGIEKLLSLERIDVRENRLRDPTEIARFTGMPEMRDVYIARNPFTKTHSNYRVKIFNLFRQSPGYTEDITIDSSGPGYSERRQLVDRVPETESVPVVKPPLEDDETGVAPNDPPQPRQSNSEETRTSTEAPETPTGEQMIVPQRRRKGPRRRIVDMAQGESPGTPGSTNSQVGSPDATFVTAVQTPANGSAQRSRAVESSPFNQTVEGRSVQLDPITPVRRSLSKSTPSRADQDQSELSETSPAPGSSSEQYRRRIEALKKEYGNGWLGALGDDKLSEGPAVSHGAQEAGKSSRHSLAKT